MISVCCIPSFLSIWLCCSSLFVYQADSQQYDTRREEEEELQEERKKERKKELACEIDTTSVLERRSRQIEGSNNPVQSSPIQSSPVQSSPVQSICPLCSLCAIFNCYPFIYSYYITFLFLFVATNIKAKKRSQKAR